MTARIDFFFFLGSTYTYLTVMRIEDVAREAGIEVRWRPFNVRAIMREQDNNPFMTKPVKMRYMWRDLERRAARHGIAFDRSPEYPIDPELLANRVATVAAAEGWCREYVTAAYRGWFLDRQLPHDPAHLNRTLEQLGQDPERVIELADSGETAKAFEGATDKARALGIFGSPSFAVGSEIFWGDDRLEDALDWCA